MRGNAPWQPPGEPVRPPHVHDACYCLDVHDWTADPTVPGGERCIRCLDVRCTERHPVAFASRCTRAHAHRGGHIWKR